MNQIQEVVKEYLEIRGKYDAGCNYTWEQAYKDVRIVAEKANELSRNCRTSETRFIARAVYNDILEEQRRLYLLAFSFKEKVS